MKNEVFERTLSELIPIFGACEELKSGNGSRFKSAKKGKVTVYHSDIESGNRAEIAFEIDSMAKRLNTTPRAIGLFVAEMKAATGRDVVVNPRFGWPRVGVASLENLELVKRALLARLGLQAEPIIPPDAAR